MIVFIPPTSIIRGVQQTHMRNGRTTKIATLAASFVTCQFNMHLMKICYESVGKEGFENLQKIISDLTTISPHFDCRIGAYSSWEEAQSLLMWRAYDCGVNGVSDAVYHSHGTLETNETKRSFCAGIMTKGVRSKLKWLHDNNKLPLPEHQRHGTLFVKYKKVKEGYNPKTEQKVVSLRSGIETKTD